MPGRRPTSHKRGAIFMKLGRAPATTITLMQHSPWEAEIRCCPLEVPSRIPQSLAWGGESVPCQWRIDRRSLFAPPHVGDLECCPPSVIGDARSDDPVPTPDLTPGKPFMSSEITIVVVFIEQQDRTDLAAGQYGYQAGEGRLIEVTIDVNDRWPVLPSLKKSGQTVVEQAGHQSEVGPLRDGLSVPERSSRASPPLLRQALKRVETKDPSSRAKVSE